MNGVPFPVGPCAFLLVATAAMWDLRTRRIPNWLVATGLIVALSVQCLLHGVTDGLLFGLGGGFTGALLMFPGYMLRMTGAGDVKLMAATGAFCGVLGAVEIVLATCVIGGIWSLATMLKRRQMRAGLQGVAAMLVTLQTRSSGPRDPSASPATQSVGTLPYGVAIALGTVVVLFSSI